MQIEHIAMYVNDLEKAKEFFALTLAQRQMMDTITEKQIFALIFCVSRTAHAWRS